MENRAHLNKIIPGLYLGNHVASKSKILLSENNITHVLSFGSGLPPKFPKDFTYMWVKESDVASTDLFQHFEACHSFIKDAISSGGRILVHCL